MRLIFAFSVEDQVVDRLLFGNLIDAEVENYDKVTSKTGWSPIPNGYRKFNSTFPSKTLATDCSAFDWTYPKWVAELLPRLILDKYVEVTEDFERAIRARLRQVMGDWAIVRFPDGRRMRQKEWGIMKSGWLCTLSFNSAAQLLVSRLAWLRSHPRKRFPLLWAMGDDVIMSWDDGDPEAFCRALGTCGVLNKFYSHERDFAGFRINLDDSVTPLYPEKHAFVTANQSMDTIEDFAHAMSLLYSLSSIEPEFMKMLREYAPLPHSYYVSWARGIGVDCYLPKVFEFTLAEKP